MPAVPKPSQVVKEKKERRGKKQEKSARKAALKADKPNRAGGAVNHYADLKAMAAAGGLSPQDVRDECLHRGLTKKTAGNYVCYLRKEGLIADKGKAAA